MQWVSDIREKVTLGDGRPLPVLLLANKCDIDSITIHPDVISNFCKQHHIDAWFLTSAKEDINIGKVVIMLLCLPFLPALCIMSLFIT